MIFFTVLLLASSTFAHEELNCHLPKNFTIDLTEDWQINILEAEMKVSYMRDSFEMFTYKKTNDVNFIMNETIISFIGNMIESTSIGFNWILNETFFTQAIGTGILKKSYFSTTLQNCQLFLPKNVSRRKSLPDQVENEIFRIATRCMEMGLSNSLGNLQSEDYYSLPDPFDFGLLSVKPQYEAILCYTTTLQNTDVKEESIMSQSVVNAIVDAALLRGMELLNQIDSLKIKIPSTNITFLDKWYAPTGQLFVTNGSISHFTSFKRTNQITLLQDGNKFAAIGGFGFENATFKYNYLLKQLISASGSSTVTFSQLAFKGKIAIEYGPQSCNATVEYLFLTRMGKFKIHVDVFGYLSTIMSKIVAYILENSKHEAKEIVRQIAINVVQNYLNELDCNKYRPADI